MKKVLYQICSRHYNDSIQKNFYLVRCEIDSMPVDLSFGLDWPIQLDGYTCTCKAGFYCMSLTSNFHTKVNSLPNIVI